jgi:hypothetical protein
MKRGLVVSLALFAKACCLPALEFRISNGPNDVMWGARALVVGWSGIFAGVMAWYANPMWLLGLLLWALRKTYTGSAGWTGRYCHSLFHVFIDRSGIAGRRG